MDFFTDWPREPGFYFARARGDDKRVSIFEVTDRETVWFIGSEMDADARVDKFSAVFVFALGPIEIPRRLTR